MYRKQSGRKRSTKPGKLNSEEVKLTEGKRRVGRPLGTKSKPGTTHTVLDTGKFDSNGIVSIINACHSNEVTEFSYNGLRIRFKGHTENDGLSKTTFTFASQPESVATVESPSPVDRELLEDVRLSQLMIDDPFGFEREILQAEAKRSVNEAL